MSERDRNAERLYYPTNPILMVFKPTRYLLIAVLASFVAIGAAPTQTHALTILRPLSIGSVGEDVTALQKFLVHSQYLTVEPTGYFGVLTEQAVMRFQKAHGLPPVGNVGPLTRTILSSEGTTDGEVPLSSTFIPVPGKTYLITDPLALGSTGTQVVILQMKLAHLTYYRERITGVFDASTRSAVLTFQREQGLEQVGSVGPRTRAALASVPLKSQNPATTSTGGSSSVSSGSGSVGTSSGGGTSGGGTSGGGGGGGAGSGGGGTTTSAPTLIFSGAPSTVVSGSSATLTWTSTNATSCTASDGFTGTQSTSGTKPLANLTSTMLYTLACTGAGGSVTKSVTITVTPTTAQTLTYTLLNSTYLDGTSANSATAYELARDVAFDSSGNMYVTGGTPSPDFPVVNAYDSTFNSGGSSLGSFGAMDAFITKIDRQGHIVWSTYFGGPNYDRAYAIEIGSNGDVFIAGRAGDGLPTTSGALQTVFAGDSIGGEYGKQDGFVARFTSSGQLVWSTYVGESSKGFIRDMDVDSAGNTYLAFTQAHAAVPYITSNAAQPNRSGVSEGAYIKLASDGSRVLYGTYFGGNDSTGVDIDNPSIRYDLARDTVYLLGYTSASNVPTTASAYQKNLAGGTDLALAKYRSDGTIAFATYLGGSGNETLETHALALDQNGNAYVTGQTTSRNFPVTSGTFQTTFGGGVADAYMAKISADGSRILSSTYLGGSGAEEGEGIVFDSATDRVIVVGNSLSSNFPTTPNALDRTLAGTRDGFILLLDGNLTQLLYSSYLGGSSVDSARGAALSAAGDIAVVGTTQSTDFPLRAPADTSHIGTWAAFASRFVPGF